MNKLFIAVILAICLVGQTTQSAGQSGLGGITNTLPLSGGKEDALGGPTDLPADLGGLLRRSTGLPGLPGLDSLGGITDGSNMLPEATGLLRRDVLEDLTDDLPLGGGMQSPGSNMLPEATGLLRRDVLEDLTDDLPFAGGSSGGFLKIRRSSILPAVGGPGGVTGGVPIIGSGDTPDATGLVGALLPGVTSAL